MDLHTRFAVALALIAVIFPSTFSAPAVPQSCSPTCRRNQDSKLQYQEGKSYVYAFETEVVTQVEGSSDESSRIKVKGQAILAAQSSCDFVLTLQQVAIQSPSGQAISKIDDIEGSSVRFAYQDGVIETVCISDSDSTWSANIKRAVVSLLSNKADKIIGDADTIEVDISGRCPTTYKVEGNKYTKTKNLNSCTHRSGGPSVLQGVPYEVSSTANSIPVVTSSLTCEQTVNNGVFQIASCVEDHKLAPVAQKSGIVHTVVKSSLTLVSTQDGLQGAKANVPTVPSTIFYDYAEVEEVQRQKSSASKAVDLLNKICSEIETGSVSSKVPGLFLQLKKAVKHVRKDDLKLMYDQISGGRLCQNAREKLEKLYLDATALAATDGSIAFVAEVIANGQVSEETRNTFHVYATFASHPGIQSLEALEKLISKSDVETEYLLTASGLAYQYCRNTNPKCTSTNEYYSLVNKISQHVRVVTDEEGTEKVIGALQALGNLNHLTPEATSAILRLLDDESVSSRLKIRALDAFRRDPCQEQLKSKALEKLANNRITSEVRIQSYLALARCVQQKDIDGIQKILSVEKSNQVGSFVQSHIRSVLKSSSPSNKILKSAFKQLKVPTPQPFDPRIFSRHDEISGFSAAQNLGFSAEGNIIFSQDSYIPRTLSGNLTFDAFGRSYNVMELGGYGEGYEQVIERIFGHSGEKINFNEIVKDSKNRWATFAGKFHNRHRREARTDIEENSIQDLQSKVAIDPNFHKEPATDIYLRVLGTTVLAETASANTADKKPLSVRLLRGMEKLVEGAKEHKCDLTEPILFLDDEIILPTIAGLPLNLQLEGTSILSLQMQGNFDLNALIRGDATDMKTRIMPSAATLLKAKMSVGSGPIESGIQIEGKIHTASGVDLKINRERGKVEVRFNIPQDRIQIIDLRSDLYWVEQTADTLEKKTPMKSTVPQRVLIDGECTTTLSKSLGLKLCADVKAPAQSFLSGPSVLSLSIEKVEPSMEGYYLKIASNPDDKNNFELDVILDTPGSRTNRKITATAKYLNYRSNTPEVKFELDSPFKKLAVDYLRSNTDALKGARVKIVNDGETYTGTAEVKRTDHGAGKYDLEPLVQYSLPNGSPVNLVHGKITREVGKKIILDLHTGGAHHLEASLAGTLQVDRPDSDHTTFTAKDLKIESEMLGKLSLDGNVGIGEIVTYDITSKFGKQYQDQYSVKGKIGSPTNEKRVFQITSRSSGSKLFNFDLDSEVVKTGNKWENFFKYTNGLEESSKTVISQQARVSVDSYKKFDVYNELRVIHPGLHIDLDLKTSAKSEPESARSADLTLRAGNTVNAVVKYNVGGADFSDYTLKADAQISGKTYEFSEVSVKTSAELRTFKTRLAVSPGFWYEADTELTHRYQKDDIKSKLTTKITSDQLSHPVTLESGVIAKKSMYGAMLKVDAKGSTYIHMKNKIEISKTGVPSSVKGELNVKNYLESSLDQSISKPASALKLNAKWIPTGRVIRLESDLKNENSVYNLNADLKWDADRDQSKSASLHSTNVYTSGQWSIDSKNEITVLGTHTGLNLKGKVAKDILNGEHAVEVSVKTNSDKTYTATLSNTLEKHSKSQSAKTHLKVQLPDTAPFELDWENRVANLDTKDCTFELLSDLKLKYKGEKNLNLRGEVNSLLPGNYRTFAGQFAANGNAIAKPVEVDIKTDIRTGRLEVSASGKRGNRQGDIEVKIDLDRFTPKKRLEIEYKLHTPFTTLKSVEGKLKYGFFFESWRNFEISDHGSTKVNDGAKYVWDASVILLENELKSVYSVSVDDDSLIQLKANGKRTGKTISGSASSIVRGQKSEINIEADLEFPNVDFKISGQTAVDSVKKFELKVVHKSTNHGQTLETDVVAKLNDKRAKITNKLEVFPQRKSIDLSLSVANQPARQLFLSLAETEKDTWTIEGKGRWGDGDKYLHGKGKLIKTGEVLDVDLNVDSPALNANKLSIRVSKKYVAGRHSVALSAESDSKKLGALSMDYAKKEERSGDQKTYDGSIRLDTQFRTVPIQFNGNFRVEDTILDKARDNGEEGRKISGNIDLSSEGIVPHQLTFVAKRSNLEKRIKYSFCNDEDKDGVDVEQHCRVAEVQLRHAHEKDGDLDYKFRAAVENTNHGKRSDIHAIVVSTVRTENGRQFENTAQLFLGQEKPHPVGYRLYRKDGHEVGAEILLPKRVIAAVLVADKKSDNEVKADLSFYIDKTKQPDRKVNLHLDFLNKVNSDSNREAKIAVVFHHPDLNKDMKISANLFGGINADAVDGKIVLDVFEADKEITLGYKVDVHRLAHGWEAKTLGSIVSKGQKINIISKGEISRSDNEISYRSEITYENRNRQIKSSKIDASLSKNRIHLEVSGSESKILALNAQWEKHATGLEIREEIYLPGMEDTRIIQTKVSTVSPHHVEWKTYTSSSAPGQFYEAYLGFKNDKHFVAGIYDHETESNHVLADLNIALNTSRVLFVKSDWDIENIRNVVTKAQARFEKTSHKLKDISRSSGKETLDEVKHLVSTLKSSTPNLRAACDSYKKQLTDLKTELESDEDTQQLLDYYDFVREFTKEHIEIVKEITANLKKSAVQLINTLVAQAETLPAVWAQILERLPGTFEAFQEAVDSSFESLGEVMKVVMITVWETIDRISENSPYIAEKLATLAQCSIEFGQVVQKSLVVALEKLTQVWTIVKQSTNDILENPTVKGLVKELIVRYRNLLAEFIKDTKEQADEFRKYILTILPGEEIQELVATIAEYIEKKAKSTPVDDAAAQKEIYNKLVAAVKKVANEIFTVDLPNGLFIAQIPLPKSIDNLTDFVKVFDVEWSKVRRPSFSLMKVPSLKYGLTETINQIKAGASLEKIVPPFRAYGIIMGSQYYRTFDGKFYHFEGNCQYLLAADFIDGNFSVAIDYDNTGSKIEKSVILKHGDDTVALKPDNTVVVNNQPTQVANGEQVGKITVYTNQDHTLFIGDNGAVTLGCSKRADVCIVTVNGYYQGKLAGLLGTYNNEEFDDFRTPTGKIEGDAEKFVAEWKLDNQCRESPIPEHPTTVSSSVKSKCSDVFEGRSSSLRPCYGVVDIKQYKHICESLSNEKGYDAEKSVCTAALGYSKACYLSNARITMPEQCTKSL